jgi:fructan beta-fructosidase
MHWGHSVSKDLVHWEHLAPAIARDTLGHIFSGSSIVDQENVAGYGAGNILAFYTSASDKNGQIQCLAFSKDNGRTFTKYEKNPILCPADGLRDFRDPKVFRYEPEDKWVMIVSADKEMRFYDSKNLKDWNYMSSFGEGYGVQPCQFECPDMVELPVDGDLNRKKWALIVNVNPGCYFGGSATQYFTGNFDGTKFSCDSQPNVTKWLDWGKDHYATVCFSNTGERTIAVPWMSNWQYCNIVPTKQFRSANALPRELSLYTQDGEIYLSAVPVPEIKTLRKEKKEIPAFTVANDYHIDSLLADNDGAYELALEITVGEAEIMGFNLFNDKGEKVDIYFNLPEKRLVMDRTKSGIVDFGKKSVSHEIEVHDRRKTTSINYIDDFALATWAPIKKENKYTLDVFVDKCSVEIFLNGGKVAMTNLIFPSEPYNRMCFYSKGGSFQVDSFKAYRLGL